MALSAAIGPPSEGNYSQAHLLVSPSTELTERLATMTKEVQEMAKLMEEVVGEIERVTQAVQNLLETTPASASVAIDLV